MRNEHPIWPFDSETPPGPERLSEKPCAVLYRTDTVAWYQLSKSEAEAVEGLLALCRSDDWKEPFIRYLLTEFREGRRAAPADVLFHMRDAVDDFKLQLDGARAIAGDYPEFLNPDAEISKTLTSTGGNVPKDEDSGERTKEAVIKGRINRAAKRLAGELSDLRRVRESKPKRVFTKEQVAAAEALQAESEAILKAKRGRK